MKKEALSQFGNPELVFLAFFLFSLCFLGVLVWTFQKSRKKHFSKMADMPLVVENQQGVSHE